MKTETTESQMLQSRMELSNGVQMPILGLGTWQLVGDDAYEAVSAALKMGYRLIDSAQAYANETHVGRAIRDSGIPREEIFVTTKIANDHHGYDEATQSVLKSLELLGLDYVDLVLIHWPGADSVDTWKALIDQNADHARAIGVSNYRVVDIEQLLESTPMTPVVNQIEVNPLHYPEELIRYCKVNNIEVEAYSPLARGKCVRHEVIRQIAQKHGKTPAQVSIRWALQHGFVTIPKSAHADRIAENAAVADFELLEGDMVALNSLSK